MNKNYSLALFFLLLFTGVQKNIFSQSVTIVVQYNGAQALGCCTVCGNDYWCINNFGGCGTSAGSDTRTFTDPIPAGNIVTNIVVNYYSAGCYGNSIVATIDGNVFPTTNEANTGCLCSNNPCGLSASSSNSFPCGVPGYVYGGSNTIKLTTGADICMDRVELTITYAPASQSTPANTPGPISGAGTFCVGVPQTFSIPAVSNAISYIWTVPAGWTINSGQGTTSINATPGSAGNICVTAHNLCGNSSQVCFPVVLNTPSSAPTSASATPPSVCGSGSSNLVLSGGSLGTGAAWNWYSGSCGGTLVGTGSSITVSASSTTTYYVRAVGSCNTTACASVVLTVNPIPTANAGSTNVLTCSTPNVVLSGSGGGSYTWSGPGIVSGGSSATPTVNQPGTYSLVVTSLGCNSSPSTVNITQNITPPSTTAGTSGTSVLTCNVTSLSLNTPASGVGYSWSGPGIVSGGTTANPVVNLPGTYSLIITNPANGCTNSSSPATVSITQNTIAIPGSASTNSVITCVSNNVNLNSTPAGYTYTWTAPGGSTVNTGVNAQNATGTGGGSYTVTIKDLTTGCFTNATVLIPQNTTPPSGVAASSGGTITCAIPQVTLSATPTSGVTYNWSGPGIVSGNTTANPVVNQSGTYSLTVTNTSNGCSNISTPATVNVLQNGAVPPANVTVTGSITCAVTSLTLSGSASAGATYSWSGPGIVSGGTTPNPVVNQPGNYTFSVTNSSSGCSNSTTVSVPQNTTAPLPGITATGNNTLTCTTTVLTLTASPSSGVTYNWTGPGIVSGNTTANPTVNQPGTYSLTITNTANGCSNSTPSTITVSQNTLAPVVTINAAGSGSITCAASNVTLTANPTTGVTYSWSGPGIVSGGTTSTPVVNISGNYSVTVTNTATGCSNATTGGSAVYVPIDITVPSANINASSINSITCTNTVVTIDATASSSGSTITYSWTTNTGIISAGANTNAPSITGPGTYTLTVYNTANGCSNTTTVTILSSVVLPTGVNAGSDTLLPCDGSNIILSGTSTSGNVTYSWQGPGNYTFSGQNATNIHLPGSYTLTVTDNITGCFSTDTLSVISQTVHAAFTADPSTGVAPLVVNFTNNSVGAASYSWNFNDGNTSTSVSPTNTFQNSGTYTVVLLAQNSSGNCSDTATTVITVDVDFSLVIPNVFTPNGDGKNDNFYIKCTGVKELSCDIFNRWGEKMYTLTAPNQAWDGITSNGKAATDGTYLYIIKVVPARGDKTVEKQGSFNLFR